MDKTNRPVINIRIKHAIILDDPTECTKALDAPPSPEYKPFKDGIYLDSGDELELLNQKSEAEMHEDLASKTQKQQEIVLEMLKDVKHADDAPPENVLFVCKLNPLTEDEDLEIIFGRFGNILECEIIKDYVTGDSLCYAFITYDNVKSCEAAYVKMDNVLIDDRRIKVDFSQSVAKLWKNYRSGGQRTKLETDRDLKGDPLVKAERFKQFGRREPTNRKDPFAGRRTNSAFTMKQEGTVKGEDLGITYPKIDPKTGSTYRERKAIREANRRRKLEVERNKIKEEQDSDSSESEHRKKHKRKEKHKKKKKRKKSRSRSKHRKHKRRKDSF